MEKVSILVPVYNVESYIEVCLHSLFEQTYNNIEYIFVDDCGTDSSISILYDVLEKYPIRKDKVKVIRHDRNRGLAAARNTALEAASGDYVIHVDSDDYLELDAIEKTVKIAKKENSDMVIFDMNLVYTNVTVSFSANASTNRLEYLHRILRRDCAVCVCGGLYRRSLYMDNGIRAIEGLNYGEDYVTKPRLVYYANRISYLPEALYNYVQCNESSYTKNVNMSSIHNVLRACDILCNFFRNKPQINYELIENEIKVRNKVFLLEYCYPKDRKFVYELFPEVKKNISFLPWKHKIVWILSRYKLLSMLNIYLNLIWRIKNTFHI